jgi:hypothetical protein
MPTQKEHRRNHARSRPARALRDVEAKRCSLQTNGAKSGTLCATVNSAIVSSPTQKAPVLLGLGSNSKFEYRNAKQIRTTKAENSKRCQAGVSVSVIGISYLRFVSDFEFRASSFRFEQERLKSRCFRFLFRLISPSHKPLYPCLPYQQSEKGMAQGPILKVT